MTLVFLVATALLLSLVNPFKKQETAWDFYWDVVWYYGMIQKVELSELEGELKAIVMRRNSCYEGLSNPTSRLKTCRKRYLNDILDLARNNIKSAPSMGKFILSVRECPLAYSMCQGTEPEETDANLVCTVREIQCIEACLDTYWRGSY